MTISQLDKVLKQIIDEHSVYGAECTINALVRASRNNKWLTEDELYKLISDAFKRMEERM